MKKILALTLSLLMVFAVIPAAMTATAAESSFQLSNVSETQISGYGCKYYPSITVVKGTESDDYILNLQLSSALSGTGKGFYLAIPESVWTNFTTAYSVTKIQFMIRTDAELKATAYMADNSLTSSQTQTPSSSVAEQSKTVTLGTTATSVVFNITETALANNRRVFYFYHRSNSSMKNIYVESATVYYEVEDVETDGETTDAIATADKASIRLNEVNGMRFFTTVDTEKLAALGTVTEMGTLIGPKNKIGDYLTMDDATAENAVAVEYGVDNDLWEGNEFVGSIVNVKDTNLNREFVARGYVKVGDTYYYSSTTSTRTLAGVADSCIADTDYYSTLDAATQALVNTWAAAND